MANPLVEQNVAQPIDIPKKRKRSLAYIGFDISFGIGDLVDDILNPILQSIPPSTLSKETRELIGPLAVSIVSILNNMKGFYENICKVRKYSKIKRDENKQREVKLNTARVMSGLSLTGIIAGSLYLTSTLTPALSTTLPFLEPILPLLPGILPGIGFAISACYLIRKAYVYHQSKKHGLTLEEQTKAQKKMWLAVMGAAGQMLLFACMMTMVTLTGGMPVVAGAMIGAGVVTLQKIVKWCVLKKSKACDGQAASAPPADVASSQISPPASDSPTQKPALTLALTLSDSVVASAMNQAAQQPPSGVSQEFAAAQESKVNVVVPLGHKQAEFSSVSSSSSSFFYDNTTTKIPTTCYQRDRLKLLAPPLSI